MAVNLPRFRCYWVDCEQGDKTALSIKYDGIHYVVPLDREWDLDSHRGQLPDEIQFSKDGLLFDGKPAPRCQLVGDTQKPETSTAKISRKVFYYDQATGERRSMIFDYEGETVRYRDPVTGKHTTLTIKQSDMEA